MICPRSEKNFQNLDSTSLSYIKMPSITKRGSVYKKNSFICMWLADETERPVTEVAR